jgi:hypothetical protein
MFLADLDPLLAGLERSLRLGGQLVLHEYMHWDTFGLHPGGRAIARFGQACQRSFREAGGDPDVNRRLPSLLAARGWRIDAMQPLPVAGDSRSMAGQWLQRFVEVYGVRLQELAGAVEQQRCGRSPRGDRCSRRRSRQLLGGTHTA